jgi:hypothetical protein
MYIANLENLTENFKFLSLDPLLNESPLGTDHLQKASFAASNHMLTHNQAYFDKINSKTPNKPKQKPNHPLLWQHPNNRRRVTHRQTH